MFFVSPTREQIKHRLKAVFDLFTNYRVLELLCQRVIQAHPNDSSEYRTKYVGYIDNL